MKKFYIIFFVAYTLQKVEAQIPNPDFEDWYPTDSMDMPVGWSLTSNLPGIPYFISPPKDTDAFTGNFSLNLSRASQRSVTANCGFAITYHPMFLHGYFKGNPYSLDTFKVTIELFNLNQIVDSGEWFYATTPINSYTPFSVNISQNASVIDSASIQLFFVKNDPSTGVNAINVDHLYFDDNSGISAPNVKNTIAISPNPSESQITISKVPSVIDQFQVTIINELGEHYERGFMKTSELSSLNISDLPQGMYEMVLQNEEKKWVGKFIRQ